MDAVKTDADEHAHPPNAPFVVGLGASAGGIEALKTFFTHVPADTGAAYIVILHLSPDHESHLAEVLQTTARMRVVQVQQRVPIEPDHVYVVSPNSFLSIDREAIAVSGVTRIEERRAPVDLFFRSLADARGSRATCVVLSGTGPNGSSGLKRVKEYGGLVIAQDPNEAEYSDMPRNSIATGLVDFVLPVAEIPAKIREFHEHLRLDVEEISSSEPLAEGSGLREILTLLRVRTGHDFSNYKAGTVLRRVGRRVRLRGLPSVQSYARAIRENPDEAVALMKDLLISVTNFFREPALFDALAERVIPWIFRNKTSQDQIRIWVPACATGEEAYSIAMLIAEHLAKSIEQPSVQIFASDLDESAVATAREALYSGAEIADVSHERVLRFFTPEAGGHRIRREIREMVLFAHHNVIKDPPFSHIDLISCRNLLIYLNRAVQERLVETFHFSLRPGGFLFVGAAETPDSKADLFTLFDKTAHVYESRPVGSRLPLPIGDQSLTVPNPAPRQPELRLQDRISPIELHHRLLERYAPPSVVVTEEHNIVHMSERLGRYMQIAGGEPSRDLLRVVRQELRPDLRAGLHQAIRQRAVIEIKGVKAILEDGERRVDITVRPALHDADPPRGFLLVTFDERDEKLGEAAVRIAAEPYDVHSEEELLRVKVQLQATIEQYETQVEEAKAGNEELQAMNEELRSAAEELETSKEELQSVNEELTTVNQELKIKIDELGLTNNDFQNLINSSDIGTIFLDRGLRVKLSTPAANQIFNLLRTDVGRPLSDITSHLLYDDLHRDVQQVLDDLRTIEREVQTLDGRWTLTRIRPYRTIDNRIDGVAITFQDITEMRRAQDSLRQGEERLRLLIDGALEYAIFTMTSSGLIDTWNSGAERMFGYRADEIVGRHFEVLFTAGDREAGVPRAELKTAYDRGRAADERFHVRKDGSKFYCSEATTRLGEALGFAKIARDLSSQQQALEALKVVEAEFDQRIRTRTDELEAEMHSREAAHSSVSGLLKRIVTAQEDERARIARDLHDQLGQQLTALRLTLEQHRERLSASGPVAPEIERALKLANEIDREVDFLAWEIRPAILDDLGLAAALPRFVREWSGHYGIAAEYRAHGFVSGQISRDAEVVFYRVAQEGLNNVAKHAHASRVDVMLESRDSSVVLVVEDDGIGFDQADTQARERGIGLAGMRERAGAIDADLQIESAPGDGTSIFLRCRTFAPIAKSVETS